MASGFLLAAGGLGLFLLGMVVMTRGLEELAGDSLRRLLARFTKTPLSGALTGAATTAVIQSSSVTTVTAVGFVGAGLLTFSQALGIILGANVGTTFTGWMVAVFGLKYRIGEFAFPLILCGVLLHLLTKHRASAIGLGVAGFGLIFVGLDSMQTGMGALEGVVTPETFPRDTLFGRVLLVLIGLAITVVTQSSSAGVATALAALSTNTITFPQAAAMVIGMDVGTTVTAALATIGGSTDARRTGFAHMIYNILAGFGAFWLLSPYTWVCRSATPSLLENHPEIALVAFHTLFNTLGVTTAIPFARGFSELMVRLVPDKPIPYTQRLGRSLYDNPSLALESVRASLKEMAIDLFGQLIGLLRKEPPPNTQTVLSEVQEALAQTREFLEPIDTSADHEVLYPKHLSLIHAMDHLGRLLDRCKKQDRADRARTDPVLASVSVRLCDAVSHTLDAFREPNGEPSEDELKAVWTALEGQGENQRHQLIEETAGGEYDTQVTIARLNALRWLRRQSYHAWRIVHHLQRSQMDRAVDAVEDIPPHREHESAG